MAHSFGASTILIYIIRAQYTLVNERNKSIRYRLPIHFPLHPKPLAQLFVLHATPPTQRHHRKRRRPSPKVHEENHRRRGDVAERHVPPISEVDEVRPEEQERDPGVGRVADELVRAGVHEVVVVFDEYFVREERSEGAV